MAEIYGEREGTRRMTNMVLQSQASWGAIDRTLNGKRLARKPKTQVNEPKLIAWLVEACVRYSGRPLPITTLDSYPSVFPFQMKEPLSYVLSSSCTVELRTDGISNQVVDVKSRV